MNEPQITALPSQTQESSLLLTEEDNSESSNVLMSLSEYHRMTMIIDHLDPQDQIYILRKCESYIDDVIVKAFHENQMRALQQDIQNSGTRNSFIYNFQRVYTKNPTLVVLGMIAILGIVFKFGYSLFSTMDLLVTNGFWGDKK